VDRTTHTRKLYEAYLAESRRQVADAYTLDVEYRKRQIMITTARDWTVCVRNKVRANRAYLTRRLHGAHRPTAS
jgi:hypothetical protein